MFKSFLMSRLYTFISSCSTPPRLYENNGVNKTPMFDGPADKRTDATVDCKSKSSDLMVQGATQFMTTMTPWRRAENSNARRSHACLRTCRLSKRCARRHHRSPVQLEVAFHKLLKLLDLPDDSLGIHRMKDAAALGQEGLGCPAVLLLGLPLPRKLGMVDRLS